MEHGLDFDGLLFGLDQLAGTGLGFGRGAERILGAATGLPVIKESAGLPSSRAAIDWLLLAAAGEAMT